MLVIFNLVLVQRMQYDAKVTEPDMTLIKVVPQITQVLLETLLSQLRKIIDRWINQRNTHHEKQPKSRMKVLI